MLKENVSLRLIDLSLCSTSTGKFTATSPEIDTATGIGTATSYYRATLTGHCTVIGHCSRAMGKTPGEALREALREALNKYYVRVPLLEDGEVHTLIDWVSRVE